MRLLSGLLLSLGLIVPLWAAEPAAPVPAEGLTRSAQNGPWSAATTWEGGQLPAAGARVQIRAGHAVVYDQANGPAIRLLHVAGQLSFAPDCNTRLDVGLLKLQPGALCSEDGFDCDAHLAEPDPNLPRPTVLVGTPLRPIAAGQTALIRLIYFEGMDRESCPALVNCGGRLELHGTPLARTWVRLGEPAQPGATEITLQEAVPGWKTGDRIILTATTRQNKIKKTFVASTRESTQTEERLIARIDGLKLTLNEPLKYLHTAEGDYRADVANLSRNVIIESADPQGLRGHTMFHRSSQGSISYTEFRHLGKLGVLGKYSLHFHLCGDTMRGSSVIGASIWESNNRWITIHGTNYLVVRDCVGYQSHGHGFFLEDGTEVNNTLDRNLAVQAYTTKPLPKQVLPYDKNDGSGFWWANCHNAFTRNVAAECDEYGYFFQVVKSNEFNPDLPIRQPDGSTKVLDIRTLPFIRFEDNEAHCQRRHSFNLGGGVPFGLPNVDGVGPDVRHPFVIRNLRLWNVHWGIHPVSPSVLLDGVNIANSEYGIWRPVYKNHSYGNLTMINVPKNLEYAFVGNVPPNEPGTFPNPLQPIDDVPPVTVVTHLIPQPEGGLRIRGTTSDNGDVTKVVVNGMPVRATRANFAEWEITLPGPNVATLTAHAEDAAGNVEQTPHEINVARALPPRS